MNSGELDGAGKLFAKENCDELTKIRKMFLEALDGAGENYREGGAELVKLCVEEMNNPNSDLTSKRAYKLINIEKASTASARVQISPSSVTNTANVSVSVSDLFVLVKQKYDSDNSDIRYSKKVDISNKRLTNGTETAYNNDNEYLTMANRAKPNARSSINWVYQQELFSFKENKLFFEKISEINQGSGAFIQNLTEITCCPLTIRLFLRMVILISR